MSSTKFRLVLTTTPALTVGELPPEFVPDTEYTVVDEGVTVPMLAEVLKPVLVQL
jgi:hypothetical protein